MMGKECSGARCSILLVDDSEEFAVPFQMMLEDKGCAVRSVRHGEAARAIAATERFDAVIVDIRLPDVSGYSLVQELRMRPAYAQVLIIGLTGWVPPGDSIFPLSMGFDHFFLKPVDFDSFERILEEKVCSG